MDGSLEIYAIFSYLFIRCMAIKAKIEGGCLMVRGWFFKGGFSNIKCIGIWRVWPSLESKNLKL